MNKLLNLVASKVTPQVRSIFFIVGAVFLVVGVLFKVNHWPGAVTILIVTMVIETVIFILSAIPQSEE